MIKILIFCVLATLSTSLAYISNNKPSGHGLFHGLDENNGKRSVFQNPNHERNFDTSQIHAEHGTSNDDVHSTKLGPDHTNSVLGKSSASQKQHKSRDLQYYFQQTEDYNPYLIPFMRKRDLRNVDQFVSEPNGRKTKCDGRKILCILRNKRQIYFEQGNVIPGSRGQAVLYGVPADSGVPGIPNQFSDPQFTYDGSQGASSGFTRRNFENGYQQFPNNEQHVGGYRTHGY